MHRAPTCPHGPHAIHEPGPWSSAWVCPEHGHVHPLQAAHRPSRQTLAAVVDAARVPVWLPRPLPLAWLVTGATYAGDERTGGRATAVACSGPNPLGGPADLLLVAEEVGVGLGARYAGRTGVDAGGDVGRRPADAQVLADGHDSPLWCVPADASRAVYVGEAAGLWLWLVFSPESAGVLLAEHLVLVDLRSTAAGELSFGALSPMLG